MSQTHSDTFKPVLGKGIRRCLKACFFLLVCLVFLTKNVLSQVVETDRIRELKENIYSDNDSIRFEALRDLHMKYKHRSMDTASTYLNALKDHVEKMNSHRHKATYHSIKGRWCSKLGKIDSALYHYQVSIDHNKKINRIQGIGDNYLLIGNLHVDERQNDSALFYYEKAEVAYLEIDFSIGFSKIYTNLGAFYSDQLGDLPKALAYYYKALKYDEERDDIFGQSLLHLNIGGLLNQSMRFEEAKKELKMGIAFAQELGDWDFLSYGYDLLSSTYTQTGDREQGINYIKLSLEYSEKIGDLSTMFNSRYKLISSYQSGEQWQEALGVLNENLTLLPEIHFPKESVIYHEIRLHLALALCYHELNRMDKFRGHLSLAEELDVPIQKLTNAEYENLLSLYGRVYETVGMYEKSLGFYHLKTVLRDSIQSDQNRHALLELQTKYATEKKEQEIVSLQQAGEIQSLELAKKNNMIVIGGLLVFVLAGGAFVYTRQTKIKREKVSLELEQRFLRSQLNPHFIFNSMGAIQQYLLTESAEKASDYLSMFSRLMRQILENSREEFITVEEEVNMLKNYLELQKMRFNNAFEYTIELDEALDAEYSGIPPMFAQPFIENALEHGLFQKDENRIVIKFVKASDDLIQLEILDSGVGVEKRLSKMIDHKSLATKITNERLEKMRVTYKTDLSLNTENIKNEAGGIEGYRVRLSLPSTLVA